jgi:hypothetical protein
MKTHLVSSCDILCAYAGSDCRCYVPTHLKYDHVSNLSISLQRKNEEQLAAAAAAAPVAVAAAEQSHPQPEQEKDEMEVETELFIGLPGRGRS